MSHRPVAGSDPSLTGVELPDLGVERVGGLAVQPQHAPEDASHDQRPKDAEGEG